MRWLFASILFSSAVLFVACPTPEGTYEICGDGADNDGDGKADCDDTDCDGQGTCVPPDYGTCARCGNDCPTQAACVATDITSERPIAQCNAGKCFSKGTFVQPRFVLNTRVTWAGVAIAPRSGSTRFIKKIALDGSAVTCDTVRAKASKSDSSAIEKSGLFNIQGIDATPIDNGAVNQGVNYRYVNTQTGGDYLLWLEFWGGPLDVDTKLPTGSRMANTCVETGANVAEVVASDNCPSAGNDAGTCRVFQIEMAGPE